jgi:hypothetical protein
MADEITTTSHNDITNASLTVPFIRRALSEKPGFWRFCKEWDLTSNFASPVMSVPLENSFWGSPNDDGATVDLEWDGTQGTDLANTAVTTSAVTCTPGEYGVALEVTDNVREDSLSAIDLFGLLEERMLHVISLAMTDDFLALLVSLSNSVGTSGADLTVAQMIAAQRGLRTRGADADAILYILDNQQANDIEDGLVAANAAAAVFALSADRLINYAPTSDNGMGPGRQIMTFRSAPVFATGLTDTANTAADVVGACFCPSTTYNDSSGATTFGMAWKRLPMLETDRIVLGRSTQLVMTARAGFVELQNDSGTSIVTDA